MTAPYAFDRRHAVSEQQETEWATATTTLLSAGWQQAWAEDALSGVWVPHTTQQYAGVLDRGPRAETRGVVLHVNVGSFDGTINYFTSGESGGVGAHFELGGTIDAGKTNTAQSVQFLPLDRIAWHAVQANGFTVGIEHAGFGASTQEWETMHSPMIANSAYRADWILRHYGLGPAVWSDTYPGPGNANVWPHHAGGASWGGHICPDGPDGIDHFPIELWLHYAHRARQQKWPA